MGWSPRESILPPEFHAAGALLEAGRVLREKMRRMVPTLFWQGEDGASEYTAVARGGIALPEALDWALTELRDLHGPPSWFGVLIDAYGRLTDEQKEKEVQPEALADLFATGDAAVVEQLVLVIAVDDRVTAWRQVYRWSPMDGWEWDEAQYMAQPVLGGGLLEIVQRHAA